MWGSHNTRGRAIHNISHLLPSLFDFISPWRLTRSKFSKCEPEPPEQCHMSVFSWVKFGWYLSAIPQPLRNLQWALSVQFQREWGELIWLAITEISCDTPSSCLFLLLYHCVRQRRRCACVCIHHITKLDCHTFLCSLRPELRTASVLHPDS